MPSSAVRSALALVLGIAVAAGAGGPVYVDGMHLDRPGHDVAGAAIGDALRRLAP